MERNVADAPSLTTDVARALRARAMGRGHTRVAVRREAPANHAGSADGASARKRAPAPPLTRAPLGERNQAPFHLADNSSEELRKKAKMTTVYEVDSWGNKKGEGLFKIEAGKMYEVDSWGNKTGEGILIVESGKLFNADSWGNKAGEGVYMLESGKVYNVDSWGNKTGEGILVFEQGKLYQVDSFGNKTGEGVLFVEGGKVYDVDSWGNKTGEGRLIIEGGYSRLELVAILSRTGLI